MDYCVTILTDLSSNSVICIILYVQSVYNIVAILGTVLKLYSVTNRERLL